MGKTDLKMGVAELVQQQIVKVVQLFVSVNVSLFVETKYEWHGQMGG